MVLCSWICRVCEVGGEWVCSHGAWKGMGFCAKWLIGCNHKFHYRYSAHGIVAFMHLSNFAPLSKQQFPSLPQLLGSFHFRRTSLRVPSRLRAISVSLDTLTSIHTYFAFYTDDEISDLFVPTIPQSVYPFLQEIFQILIRQSPRTIHSLSSFPSNQTQPIVFSFHPFHCRAFWVFTRSVACLTVDMTHLCSDR